MLQDALVDLSLATKHGVERLHGKAGAFRTAIATTLAHRLVDNNACLSFGGLLSLEESAEFVGADLVINKHGDTLNFGEYYLCLI